LAFVKFFFPVAAAQRET